MAVPPLGHGDADHSGHGGPSLHQGAGASQGVAVPQFPIPAPPGSSLPATMPSCASGGRSPREPRVDYDKNRALFWDKCNQSWVLQPGHRDGEHSSSPRGRRVPWCRCTRRGVPACVCQRWCPGERVPQASTVPERWRGGLSCPCPLCWALDISATELQGRAGSPACTCLLQPWQAGRNGAGAGAVVARRAWWGQRQHQQHHRGSLWDRHDTVGLGTGEGTLTCPIPGRLVQPRELCVHTAPGLLQPAELSSDAHARTHTHTCTHTHVRTYTHTPRAHRAAHAWRCVCTRRICAHVQAGAVRANTPGHTCT